MASEGTAPQKGPGIIRHETVVIQPPAWYYLEFENGKKTSIHAITFSIGRDGSNDLVYDQRISSNHCILTRDASGAPPVLKDTSRNGILVDGRKVPKGEEVQLNWGQRVELTLPGPASVAQADSCRKSCTERPATSVWSVGSVWVFTQLYTHKLCFRDSQTQQKTVHNEETCVLINSSCTKQIINTCRNTVATERFQMKSLVWSKYKDSTKKTAMHPGSKGLGFRV
jgi:hypothetical protein